MKLSKKLLLILIVPLFLGSLFLSNKPVYAVPTFASPTAGATISNTIQIIVNDPLANYMDFYLYSTTGGTGGTKCRDLASNVTATSPGVFQLGFNTLTVTDGSYGLSAKAHYTGGGFNQIYQANTISNGLTGPYCGNPNPASVDIKARGEQGPITISSGESVTIGWTSTNIQNCTINGTTGFGPNGSFSSGPLVSSKTYVISCSGKIGFANDSVEVNVSNSGSSPPPSSSPPTSGPPASSSPPSGSSGGSGSTSGGSSTATGQKTVESITPETLASSDKIVVEQDIPVSIGEFDPDIFLKGSNIKITAIKNITQDGKVLLHFEGKTKPNTLVTLYIFSNPVIVTVKSDAQGVWSYDRERNIETGKHSAFATIYDDGVTRRSDVSSFYIAKGKAGSDSLILQGLSVTKMAGYVYVFASAIIVSVLILITFRFYQRRGAKL